MTYREQFYHTFRLCAILVCLTMPQYQLHHLVFYLKKALAQIILSSLGLSYGQSDTVHLRNKLLVRQF